MSVKIEHKDEVATGFPQDETFIVFGAPKSGKTRFVVQWPKPLLIEMDKDGDKYVKGFDVAYPHGLKDLEDIVGMLAAQAKAGKLEYETVILDSIDAANVWAEEQACKELKIAKMGDAEWGKDWVRARDIVMNLIKMFSNLPCNMIVVAHSKWAMFDEVSEMRTTDLPGRLSRLANSIATNIIYIGIDKKGNSRLNFKPSPAVEAGSRNPILVEAGSCEYGFEPFKALFEKEAE